MKPVLRELLNCPSVVASLRVQPRVGNARSSVRGSPQEGRQCRKVEEERVDIVYVSHAHADDGARDRVVAPRQRAGAGEQQL